MLTLTSANGRLDAAQLVVVDTGPNGAQQLRADVAPLWFAMLAAGMPAGCLRSGYRTRAQQAGEVAAAAAGHTPSAAPVGKSFHGEGVAADVDEPARDWIREASHAALYGVVLDTVPREPWHVLIDPARATWRPAPTPAPHPLPLPLPTEDTMRIVICNGRTYVASALSLRDITGDVNSISVLTTMYGAAVGLDTNGLAALRGQIVATIADTAKNLKGQGL